MRFVLLAVLVLLAALVACAPSEADIAAAVEATVAAAPTATAEPTAIPTVEPTVEATATAEPEPTAEPTIEVALPTLGEIIAAAADTIPPPLLADFVRDAPTHIREDVLGGLDEPADYVMQELYSPERDGTWGAAIIYLYDDGDAARRAYGATARQLDGMGYDLGVSNPNGVGERATMEDLDGRIYLAFARCNGFVFIWTTDARPFDVLAYATRIDELLAPTACG